MPPVRTSASRASKACETCRKGKQRCYATPSGACLRCTTLDLACSLQADPAPLPQTSQPTNTVAPPHDCFAVEGRIAALERTVQRLSRAISLDPDLPPSNARESLADAAHDRIVPLLLEEPEAPLQVIHDAASDTDDQGLDSPPAETIIDRGLLAPHEVTQLLVLFRAHYARWIALREEDPPLSDADISTSPLLLCACCLIAIRHSSVEWAQLTAPLLFTEAKRLLGEQLLQPSQPVSFFQAVLILSLWSTTVGQKPLSLDSCLISGYALQQSGTSGLVSPIHPGDPQDPDPSSVGRQLLWCRLCLSHLHACVSMRRPTVLIGKREVNHVTNTLSADDLTNFETRMLAELSLYWVLYDSTVANSMDLPQAQAVLREWKARWSFLFDQPRPQFLQLSSYFAELLLLEQALSRRSAAAKQSVLTEMVRLSSAMLQVARDTTDDRTKHLTDHIYHMIAFAAVTLCRLLRKYSDMIQLARNPRDLDIQIVESVRWLRSLGSSLHIGHIMGNAIDAVHRRLRPEARIAAPQGGMLEHGFQHQVHMFPDLLGMGPNVAMNPLDLNWDGMIPDWQSYASDDFGNSI